MKLYKYRSLEHLEYTLDILLNKRLHCALYDKLNDPFEGVFLSIESLGFGTGLFGSAPFGGSMTLRTQSIADLHIPGETRVCSLSKSKTDVRLWSHYANGHTGIAIEVDIDNNDRLYEVEYVKKLKEISNTVLTAPETAEILRVKSHHWDYEREFRIISREEYFSIKITGIYFGLRTSPLMREMILKFVGNSIPVYSTKLNEKTIEIKLDDQVNKDASGDRL